MVYKDYKHLVGGIKRVSLTLSPFAANPLYGTKILNLKTQEIGLLICLWENIYTDKTADCLGFLPSSQSFAFMPLAQYAQSARYPVVAVQKSALQLALIKTVNDTILNLIT